MTRTNSQARRNFAARTIRARFHLQDNSAMPTLQIDCLTGDPNLMTSGARSLAVLQAFLNQKRQMTDFSPPAG